MDVTCTIVWLVWRPESGMKRNWTPLPCLRGVQNREWSGKWTPLSCRCGVQNLVWSGNGRPYYVGVASRIGDGVEMDATAMLMWRPESGLKRNRTPPPCWCGVQNREWSGNGRPYYVGVASRIGEGVEVDAIAMLVWRPESGMKWKWTPVSCWCGVQNRGWSGNWTPVLCRCGVQNREWSGKWTPLSCRCGVQNLVWSGNGRHCHVCVASRIGNGVEMDARIMFAWRPESGMEWKWTPLPC